MLKTVLAALFLFCASAPCSSAQTASLSITVTDSSYHGISDVAVKVVSQGHVWRCLTDSSGRFTILEMPAGETFSITADRGDGTELLTVTGLISQQGGRDLPVSIEYGIIHKGDRYAVRLPSNPTTGYSWEIMAGGADSPFKYENRGFVTEDTLPGSHLRCGAGGTETLVFRATGLGRSNVLLGYIRGWEQGISPVRYHICTVMSRIRHK